MASISLIYETVRHAQGSGERRAAAAGTVHWCRGRRCVWMIHIKRAGNPHEPRRSSSYPKHSPADATAGWLGCFDGAACGLKYDRRDTVLDTVGRANRTANRTANRGANRGAVPPLPRAHPHVPPDCADLGGREFSAGPGRLATDFLDPIG